MQKIFCFLWIPIVASLLLSCSWSQPGESGSTSPPTENLSALTYPPSHTVTPDNDNLFLPVQNGTADDVTLLPSDTRYDVKTPDGKILLNVSFTFPSVTVTDNPSLEKSIQNVLTESEKIFRERADFLSRRYTGDAASDYHFLCTPSYSVVYGISSLNENRVSLAYSVSETNADGEIRTFTSCLTIDLKGGFAVDLSTLFTAGLSERLLTMVNRSLSSGGYRLYTDYESIAAQQLRSSWLLVSDGICFRFSAGTIASADQGEISIRLTAAQINEFLSEYGDELIGVSDAYAPETD